MNKRKTKAFTLTELLVVIIVLCVFAAVAVPKFTRVLETRRTTEAEDMLKAVRTEQEKRCTMGQNYTGSFSKISTLASLSALGGRMQSANYTYTLTETGASADRPGKNYSLKMPSYKSGQICCEGSGCDELNKDYPLCGSLPAVEDECAATDVDVDEPELTGPCDIDPNSCECKPNQAKCCSANEEWNGSSCVTREEDTCVETQGPSVEVTSSALDECDGNTTAQYKCDGHFRGTCKDVYKAQVLVGGDTLQESTVNNNAGGHLATTMASYVTDPFLDFQDAIILAQMTADKVTVGGGNGLNDNLNVGDTSNPGGNSGHVGEDNGNKEVERCIDGQHYDEKLKKCVPDVPVIGGDGGTVSGGDKDDSSDDGSSDKDDNTDDEKEEEGGNKPSVGQVITRYMQREVTCCGDGR